MLAVLTAIPLLAWLYLLLAHGRFWRADQILPHEQDALNSYPPVAVVIPARNEADGIARTIQGLLSQDYSGQISVWLVDDSSDDGTADIARDAAQGDQRLTVIENQPLVPGWAGKMWAVNTGLSAVPADNVYVLLTDADIIHEPGLLRRLVTKSEHEGLVLTSLMVRLNCETVWEKLLIPAFVFFFQKRYPFPRVNNPKQQIAAAAGGCMLIRKSALDAVGGVTSIRDAIIDDCALARLLKKQGPIWLGLAEQTRPLRQYTYLHEIWDMVARTAYTQLNHSPVLLIGSVLGMIVLYLMPVVSLVCGLLAGDSAIALPAAFTLSLMTICFLPTIQLYRLPLTWALTLPVAGLLYGLMTWTSGYRHWRGRGAGWKGRTYSRTGDIGHQSHD